MTESLSFGVTGNVTYIPPFALARTFSTLDHLTDGRAAWNVVTGWSKAAANAFGTELKEHDKRYEIGEEYMDVVYKLVISELTRDYVLTVYAGCGMDPGPTIQSDGTRRRELLTSRRRSKRSSMMASTPAINNLYRC